MSKVVNFVGLGHINIVVDNIDNGIEFYQTLFGAEPYQIFRDFCNEGFSKAAGFLDDPKSVKLNIAFMEIPGTKLILELMEYINPEGKCKIVDKTVADMAGVRHVALKVEGIEDAYKHVSQVEGVRLINSNENYVPYKIDAIKKDEFMFFDEALENNEAEKENVVKIISNTKYFYFIDKYGVQWEFEQGHTDVGNDN